VKRLNNRGFTLLEMLIALSLFMIIAASMVPLLKIMHENAETSRRISDMEWEVFCSQSKKEIRMSTKVNVLNNKLVLENSFGTVIYEMYGDKLRRRVNFSGHEVILQNVNGVAFEKLKSTLTISAEDLDGNVRKVSVTPFLSWAATP